MGEARRERLGDERGDLVVAVAEPPGRGGEGGVAGGDDLALVRSRPGPLLVQELERLLGRQRVLDVTEVDAADEVLRRHVAEELPQWLALALRPQVPDRHDHGGLAHPMLVVREDDPAFRPLAGERGGILGAGSRTIAGTRVCPAPARA